MFTRIAKVTALLCSLLLVSSPVSAATLTVDPDRTLYVTGTVRGSIITKAGELEKMSARSAAPIYLVINSGGGSVIPGLQFVNAMLQAQERGVTIKCVTPVLAMSMAFFFLTLCDERYAFENSLLLWHPMKTSMSNASADDLAYESALIRELEGPMLRIMIAALNITPESFLYHYKHETIWTANMLRKVSPKFLNIITDVRGARDLFELGD
jgi:ATP-dependent protease ClpP protease subunit